MNIATTIEQSKKLLKLGVNPETADMGWNIFIDNSSRLLPIDDWDLTKDGNGNVKLLPAWSLKALFKLMPKPIKVNGEFAYPSIILFNNYIVYTVGMAVYKAIRGEDLIDAAVKMIEWLVINNYIKV